MSHGAAGHARNNRSRVRRRASKPIWKCELQDFPAYGNADDKKDQAHHEEEKEQEFCNSAAADAMPVNPNKAATSAITRKITAQRNILSTSSD